MKHMSDILSVFEGVTYDDTKMQALLSNLEQSTAPVSNSQHLNNFTNNTTGEHHLFAWVIEQAGDANKAFDVVKKVINSLQSNLNDNGYDIISDTDGGFTIVFIDKSVPQDNDGYSIEFATMTIIKDDLPIPVVGLGFNHYE